MKFLPSGFNTKDLEKDIKNKWRWDWLSECDSIGGKWCEWLKKPDTKGMAFCDVCAKSINYKSNGKKSIRQHAEDKIHQKNLKTVKTNEVIPGSSKADCKKVEGMPDRIAKQKTIVTSFISEHCLPFSLASDLLDLMKKGAEDKAALEKTTFSSTSATYINTHGVAKAFKTEVQSKVKNQFISLNLDEATNNNMDKVLNILIQYFDFTENKVVIDHLGSRIQNVATAADIVNSVESVLQEYDIAWTQVVSVLMDNCSTMRGQKGGVETLIREKNTNLLDISGDTIHMLNNVAKTLMKSVDQGLQNVCSNIYYAIEKSPKVKALYCEVMKLMNAKRSKHLLRPIDNRFLQMHDVTTRVVDVLDYLTVYYASFLSEEEKTQHRPMLEAIFKAHGVSEEAQAEIMLIQMAQDAQEKSDISVDRKDLIIDALFTSRKETIVKLNLCRGLLSVFQGYVKKFQTEAPQIHVLHENMEAITKKFLALFIKPEYIPKDSVSALMKLDITDPSIKKDDSDLSVGHFAQPMVTEALHDKSQRYWLKKMFENLRKGYVDAGKKIMKLPLDNKTIRRMSVLDPELHGHSQTSKCFKLLAQSLPNVVPVEDLGCLDMELNAYSVDEEIGTLADNYNNDSRIDVDYWSKIIQLKTFTVQRYPLLCRLACSLLASFSGPLIEGTFNVMDDIIETDRSTITIENYEGVAIVKMGLKKRNIKAHQMKVTPLIKRSVITAHSTYQRHLRERNEKEEKERQDKLEKSKQKLKFLKAKHLLKLKKRIINKQKRKVSECTHTSTKKFKRIKTMTS